MSTGYLVLWAVLVLVKDYNHLVKECLICVSNTFGLLYDFFNDEFD